MDKPEREKLINTALNNLDMTWADEALCAKIEGILVRGMVYLDRIAGGAQDYGTDAKPLELLLEYCRYAVSDALDLFATNYQHELIALQADAEVARYAEAKEA